MNSIVIYNKYSFTAGVISLFVALLFILSPRDLVYEVRALESSLGVSWLYFVEYSNLIFLFVGICLLDYSTKGSWWKKNGG